MASRAAPRVWGGGRLSLHLCAPPSPSPTPPHPQSPTPHPPTPCCVVTAPWSGIQTPLPPLRALINPSNPSLSGAARAYFPRGGPLPPAPPPGLETSSRGWGGLDAGEGMVFPAAAVDALTHLHAGPQLREALAAVRVAADGRRCPVGAAVLSPPFGLSAAFERIAHTPPPLWRQGPRSAPSLGACYTSSILALAEGVPLGVAHHVGLDRASAARRTAEHWAIATPLVGAGAAGAPVAIAAGAAVEAFASLSESLLEVTVRLVLIAPDALEAVERALEEEQRRGGRLRPLA
ncbi:hypothetical protein AB1Y20_013467 [Prymnesium parvum]|uniref:Macro domain-containing protein n=1 Tax=Prymnesium parvum TaxID=97485 RepID=A0AB34IHX7_PRYPA